MVLRPLVVVPLLAILVPANGASAAATLQAPPPASADRPQGVREVRAQAGVPITSLLTATDIELRVIEPYPIGATSGPPPGEHVLEVMTRASQYVALVKVSVMKSHLTSDGTWIDADATLSPLKILKSVGLRQAGPLTVRMRGGDLIVGRQLIRAMRAGVSQMREGETYLVFVEQTTGRPVLEPINVFHAAGAALIPLVDNPIHGVLPKIDEALSLVARAAKAEVAR